MFYRYYHLIVCFQFKIQNDRKKGYITCISHFFAEPKQCFQMREFCYTLENDVYVRFQCFMDQEDMASEIKKNCPHKIDIGAIYNKRCVLSGLLLLILENSLVLLTAS